MEEKFITLVFSGKKKKTRFFCDMLINIYFFVLSCFRYFEFGGGKWKDKGRISEKKGIQTKRTSHARTHEFKKCTTIKFNVF